MPLDLTFFFLKLDSCPLQLSCLEEVPFHGVQTSDIHRRPTDWSHFVLYERHFFFPMYSLLNFNLTSPGVSISMDSQL